MVSALSACWHVPSSPRPTSTLYPSSIHSRSTIMLHVPHHHGCPIIQGGMHQRCPCVSTGQRPAGTGTMAVDAHSVEKGRTRLPPNLMRQRIQCRHFGAASGCRAFRTDRVPPCVLTCFCLWMTPALPSIITAITITIRRRRRGGGGNGRRIPSCVGASLTISRRPPVNSRHRLLILVRFSGAPGGRTES